MVGLRRAARLFVAVHLVGAAKVSGARGRLRCFFAQFPDSFGTSSLTVCLRNPTAFVIVASSHHPEKFARHWRSHGGTCLYRKDFLWETIETMATIFPRA